MPELKVLRVREAKLRDIGLFRKLWTQLLEAQGKQGAVRDAQAMTLYESLFNAYVDKRLDGIVYFVADKGVLMWGDSGPMVMHTDKTVSAWGDYSSGLTEVKTAMLAKAEAWAKSQGYVNVLYETFGNVLPPEGYSEIGRMFKKRL